MKPHEPFDPDKEPYELDLDDDEDEIESAKPDISPARNASERNEGEGNRTAARSYQEKLEKFIADGRVGAAARDAANAVDGPEGPELRAAEEAGKSRSKVTKMQALKGIARAFIGGAKAAYEESKQKK